MSSTSHRKSIIIHYTKEWTAEGWTIFIMLNNNHKLVQISFVDASRKAIRNTLFGVGYSHVGLVSCFLW